jgi:phage I-like protein
MSETRNQESAARLSEVRDGLVRIMVACTGEFDHGVAGKFKIVPETLEAMMAGLAQREAPIDYEHLGEDSEPLPPGTQIAAGWMRRPAGIEPFPGTQLARGATQGQYLADRKALWVWASFTPAMAAMLKQEEYRYFSPYTVWASKAAKEQGGPANLKSGAMTNRPFLEDMPPIELSGKDYAGLFGLAERPDGKLPSVGLSDRAAGLIDVNAVHVPTASHQISVGSDQPGEGKNKEKQMSGPKNLTMKCGADGKTHEVFDGDTSLGAIQEKHLKEYASNHLGMCDGAKMTARVFGFEVIEGGKSATEQLASELGVEPTATLKDVKGLIDRGRTAATAAKEPDEMAALKDCVDDKGAVKMNTVHRLVDEGKVKPSFGMRLRDAEDAVKAALADGRIKPPQRTAAINLYMRDRDSFDLFVAGAARTVPVGAPRGLNGTDGDGNEGTPNAWAKIEEGAAALAAEKKIPHAVALKEFTTRNPEGKELWKLHKQQERAAARAAQ